MSGSDDRADTSGDPTLVVEAAHTDVDVVLEEGTRVGRYLVLEKAGQGGMGMVFRAYDPRLHREVALKLLRRGRRDDPDSEGNLGLVNEARAMARLSHPNVMPVYDVDTTSEGLCIAMEFVEGRTLSQWCAEASPSRSEVLEAFRAAGAGLSAAHAAGLIHRDFKPSNVLVGEDGRIRVMDFGVAHWDDAARRANRLADDSDSESALTGSVAVVGTPAYMAPEQHEGRTVDARTDQYAFCIAFFEALAGRRPFTVKGTKALHRAKVEGDVDWPSAKNLPTWIRRILEKGLDADPDRRFANLEDLLAALGRDPARRRKRAAIVLGGVVFAGATIGWAEYTRRAASEVCAGSQSELESAWNESKRAKMADAFRRSGRDHAEETLNRVGDRIDRYADAWRESHRDGCLATNVRREQSQQLLDLRMACLQRRRDRLTSLVDVLADADADVVERAVTATDALPRLDPCADADYLMASLEPPEDPVVARRVTELRSRLAESETLATAGKHVAARVIATEVLEEARRLDYRPLLAEALLTGAHGDRASSTDATVASLEEAYFVALGLGYDQVAFDAAQSLVFAYGETGRFDLAHQWASHARGQLERRPGPDRESTLYNALGAATANEGKFDESLEYFERAIEKHREADGSALGEARMLANMAAILMLKMKIEEAEPLLRRSLTIMEDELGSAHPSLSNNLNNLAVLYVNMGKYDDALAPLERTLKLDVEAHGLNSPAVATSNHNIAAVMLSQGRHDDARVRFEQVLAVREKILGPDHRDVGFTLSGLGNAYLHLDRADDARPILERAHQIQRKMDGATAATAETRFLLARALWRSEGERSRAATLAQEAADGYAKMGDPMRGELEEVQTWLASHPVR